MCVCQFSINVNLLSTQEGLITLGKKPKQTSVLWYEAIHDLSWIVEAV